MEYAGKQSEAAERNLPWLLEWLIVIIQGFMQGFAAFGEVLMWLAAGTLLAYLIVWFAQQSWPCSAAIQNYNGR